MRLPKEERRGPGAGISYNEKCVGGLSRLACPYHAEN